jgi:polar amino acid transport system substrate-binding protein
MASTSSTSTTIHADRARAALRRRTASLVVAIGLPVALAGCAASAEQGSVSTAPDLVSEGRLTVCTDMPYAPFESLKDGEPVGFDIDLLKLITDNLGVKANYTDLPWASVLPGLEAKKFDMVTAGTTITKARSERYLFTLPIGNGTVGFVKRKGDKSINKPDDVIGKVIGGVKGSQQLKTTEDYIAKLPNGGVKELKIYVNSTEAYSDLAAGRISAVSGALPNLAYLAKTRPDEFELVPQTFGPPAYLAWVLRKDAESETLRKAINAELAKLNKAGKVKELQEKWFGVAMELPTENVPEPMF